MHMYRVIQKGGRSLPSVIAYHGTFEEANAHADRVNSEDDLFICEVDPNPVEVTAVPIYWYESEAPNR